MSMMKKQQGAFDVSQPSLANTAPQANQDDSKAKDKEFIIQDADKYPHRLIGFIKIKIFEVFQNKTLPANPQAPIMGSGCLISHNLFLTAAHNVVGRKKLIDQICNRKSTFEDKSYIRQGLGLGGEGGNKQSFIQQFKIKQYLINPDISQSKSNDFALLELEQKGDSVKQEKFMPIVSLSEKSIDEIKDAWLYGYPVAFNKKQAEKDKNQHDQSSMDMNFLSGGMSKSLKKGQNMTIRYSIPSQYGTSGAPLIALFRGMHIIIGIHKGKDNETNEKIGVSAGQMIETLNQKGYELQQLKKQKKRPLVYTDNTLSLREKEDSMHEKQVLFLMNKGLEESDILVLTAFDLSNIQKITLSGNRIGSLGVEFLLRRNYPKIKSLFLHQNQIDDFKKIPEANWKNIQNVINLGLSVNKLTTLPVGFKHLKEMKELWVSTNQIKTIPDSLEVICQANNRESLTIYLYRNFINLPAEKQKIEKLSTYKTKLVWEMVEEKK